MEDTASTLFRDALQCLPDALMLVDESAGPVFANAAWRKLVGLGADAPLPSAELLLALVDEEDRLQWSLAQADLVDAERITYLNDHCLVQHPNGEEFPFELRVTPIGRGWLLALRDLLHVRSLTDTLHYQRSHDVLTGLVNRGEFERRLQDAVAHMQGESLAHTIAYLDLDQFKVVNDTCGHIAGDELLRQYTELLRSELSPRDVLARLGGDEFGILLWQQTLDEALAAIERLRKRTAAWLFLWNDKSFSVSLSVGLAELTAEHNWATALQEVDAACYYAKEKGGNQVKVFTRDDLQLAQRQTEMQWVSRIVQALQENRFVLYAQPIVCVRDPTHVPHQEILVRLRDVDGSIIPPGAFLPAAERFNLILMIDRWVLTKTFEWLTQQRQKNRTPPVCGVNVSGASIGQPAFLQLVMDLLVATHVPPAWVCFEITETQAIENFSVAKQFIEQVRGQGCRFAIDDFGAGMSSFGYLKNLPADYLKIDGAFVRELPGSAVDAAMVKSINEVGKIMGMKTIAEFVENEAILEALLQLGVDFAQGYGVGKPQALRFEA